MRLFFVFLCFQTGLLQAHKTCLAQSLTGHWNLKKFTFPKFGYTIDLSNKDARKELLNFQQHDQQGSEHKISRKFAKTEIDKIISDLEDCSLIFLNDNDYMLTKDIFYFAASIPGWHIDTLGGKWSYKDDSLTLSMELLEDMKALWQFKIIDLTEHNLKLQGISQKIVGSRNKEMAFGYDLEFTR